MAEWSKYANVDPEEARLKGPEEARRSARLKRRIEEKAIADAKRRIEDNPYHMIEVDDDSDQTSIVDVHWYDAGITYDVLFPKMYEGKNVTPSAVPTENLPYLGDSARVIKKGTCGCDCCCSCE